MKIQLLDSASRDLTQGYRFYEQQREGLGDYFVDSLFSDIDSLILTAGVHPQHFGYHRLLARRFPFSVYYKVDQQLVKVYAVLDNRSSPAWTREVLQG